MWPLISSKTVQIHIVWFFLCVTENQLQNSTCLWVIFRVMTSFKLISPQHLLGVLWTDHLTFVTPPLIRGLYKSFKVSMLKEGFPFILEGLLHTLWVIANKLLSNKCVLSLAYSWQSFWPIGGIPPLDNCWHIVGIQQLAWNCQIIGPPIVSIRLVFRHRPNIRRTFAWYTITYH